MPEKADMTGKNTGRFLALIPALITAAVFLCVMAAKGIFPFGAGTIDYYDMGQINAPLYYHAWDMLHGNSALFFDWYINEGQNIAMAASNQWNLSPFILSFLLVPRPYLMRFLSIYIMLHLMGMTVSMQYFLFRVFPDTPRYFRYIFSAAYGMCGYTLTHYTTPTFLDTAVFIPILMLMLYRLLKERKFRGYALMLALSLIVSYYLGAIDMIFLLITGGAYILLLCPKEDKADRAGKLVTGTVLGILMSAVVTVPVFFSLAKSSRINENYDSSLTEMILSILRAIGADQYYVKFWQLYAMEAAGLIILLGLWRFRKERKKTFFAFLFFFAPCALIPFEGINLIWHLGSYFHYPIRCGYLIPFSVLTVAAYYSGRLWQPDTRPDKNKILFHIPAAILSAAIAVVALMYFYKHEEWQVEAVFKLWLVAAVGFLAVYALIFLIKKIPTQIFLWFMLCELIIGAAVGYGKPHIYDRFFSDPEQSGDYVESSIILADRLQIEPSRLFRIKNPDTSLNANYGMIMRRATFCGWAQTLSRPFQKGAEKLGYSTHFMRILDSGGTAFSDALLGVTEAVMLNNIPAEPSIYEKKSSYGDYTLYKLKNALPYVKVIPKDEALSRADELDIVDLHNYLYFLLSGEDGLAEWLEKGEDSKDSTIRSERIEGRKLLYLRKGEADEICVNGSPVPVPTITEPDNTEYPAWFNSNLICLGEFEDEDIDISCPAKSEIFALDAMRLERLSEKLAKEEESNGSAFISAGSHRLTFEVNTDEPG